MLVQEYFLGLCVENMNLVISRGGAFIYNVLTFTYLE